MFPVRCRHQRCLHTLLSSLVVEFACLRALRTRACPQEPSPVQTQGAFRRMPLRWWWNAVKVWQKAALDHSSVYILSVVGNWLGPLPQPSCVPLQQLSALWVYVFWAALEDLLSSYRVCLYSTKPSDLKAEHCFLIFLHTTYSEQGLLMQNDGWEPVSVAANSVCVFTYTVLGFKTAPILLPGVLSNPIVTAQTLTGSYLILLMLADGRRITRWSHFPPEKFRLKTAVKKVVVTA